MPARAPDWLVYGAILALLLLACIGRGHANAPPAPPPVPGADQAPIAPDSPFANDALKRLPGGVANRGTAVSLSDHGVWLTARRAVQGCQQPLLVVAEGWGAPARLQLTSGDVAVLTTHAGAPALRLAKASAPRVGEADVLAGFSRGAPAEVAALAMGREAGSDRLAWAEIGRTDGLKGPFFGMAGAPVLNLNGEVVALALADRPTRGRLSAAPATALVRALTLAKARPDGAPTGQPITLDNYGRAADMLRRALSVVEVVCAPG
jgi:hypothetical protein